jgi:hypothetical protein
MKIYKHTHPTLNVNIYILYDKYSWGDIITDGVLSNYEDITDLSQIYNLYLQEQITYTQYKRYLDEWHNYHNSNGNTEIINQNKDYLLRANTLGRDAIYQEYGNLAFYILDEYHTRSKNCREKLYNCAVTVIRTFVDLSQQVQILGVVNQYRLADNYIKYGIEGKNYGDAVAGIMDFIEGTNEFAGNGIADMDLITKFGKTKDEIIQQLKKYIVYGEIN